MWQIQVNGEVQDVEDLFQIAQNPYAHSAHVSEHRSGLLKSDIFLMHKTAFNDPYPECLRESMAREIV